MPDPFAADPMLDRIDALDPTALDLQAAELVLRVRALEQRSESLRARVAPLVAEIPGPLNPARLGALSRRLDALEKRYTKLEAALR